MVFRPWGELEWLLKKLPDNKYSLLGCLATETRCSGVFRHLHELKRLNFAKFIEIKDPTNTNRHDELRAESQKIIEGIAKPDEIEQHSLLEPTQKLIESCNAFIAQANGCVVLDITAFPKRFFFPLVKLLYKNTLVKNLIITYTVPQKYVDGNLSDNPQSWAPVPLYSPPNLDEDVVDLAIIGIGFMPLGLPNFLKDKQNQLAIKFLFPFPPGPPYYQRTWDFVNQIDESTKIDTKQIYRIDSKSVPSIFDKISSLSRGKRTIFAPYGPKTMSVAMCLYAVINDSAVYYTQPTSYAANYSEGCGHSHAFLVKLNGEHLYK